MDSSRQVGRDGYQVDAICGLTQPRQGRHNPRLDRFPRLGERISDDHLMPAACEHQREAMPHQPRANDRNLVHQPAV